MYKLCNENSENEAQQWACGPDKQNNELKEAKQEHGAVGSSGDSTLWIDHLVREPFPVCFAVCDWYVDGDFYSFYLEQYIDSWANSLLARITSVLQTCLLPCKCKLEKKKTKAISRVFKVKMEISEGIQWHREPFQGRLCFAYSTGTEISEGLHSWLSMGGTELRLKEPED